MSGASDEPNIWQGYQKHLKDYTRISYFKLSITCTARVLKDFGCLTCQEYQLFVMIRTKNIYKTKQSHDFRATQLQVRNILRFMGWGLHYLESLYLLRILSLSFLHLRLKIVSC